VGSLRVELMGVSHAITVTKSSANGISEKETIRNDKVLIVLDSSDISFKSVV
jgi:hypothetical protein